MTGNAQGVSLSSSLPVMSNMQKYEAFHVQVDYSRRVDNIRTPLYRLSSKASSAQYFKLLDGRLTILAYVVGARRTKAACLERSNITTASYYGTPTGALHLLRLLIRSELVLEITPDRAGSLRHLPSKMLDGARHNQTNTNNLRLYI